MFLSVSTLLILSGCCFVPFCGLMQQNFNAKTEYGTIQNYMVLQERYQSSDAGSFTRMLRDLDTLSGASLLQEIYMSDPERVVQIFETQPSLDNNPMALST